ncbi:SRPBCC family protein [Microbacterium hydrocarbonoxydans]|uniref:SRPBCC family protein n=1 Tax=Microbacterium hydrocarbonoxydans TaxID=273678 RepID=UPI002040BFFE|nr:SRPBCC family protein [Microbacterium hydrocarbonoxydans]MCM3779741.1 SRPBCC family protein [Microbacterium hydrocarbonoxydans]
MAKNVRTLDCRPEDVFDVLADGWLYPAWVVGASRMRDVDETWPQPGAELHHSVGVWPALLDDATVVEEWDPPRRMVMRAKGWPIGEARVTLRVRSYDGGCMVRIDEEPVNGPATLLPGLVTTPMLRWRNSETLHRLAYLAEGGAGRAD